MWGNSFLVISIVKVDFNELEQILYAVHRQCFLVKIKQNQINQKHKNIC